MTQAFNLSQLANKVNTSGQLDVATGVTGTQAVANGGTGQSTYTNGQLLIGNTTGNTLTKATLTAGTNITITNGAGAITIAASGGAPTTAQVLDATAGATANAVGTYAFLGMTDFTGTAITNNTNYAGSKFCFAGFRLGGNAAWNSTSEPSAIGGFGGGSPSGTWKAMGEMSQSSNNKGTVFLRVS